MVYDVGEAFKELTIRTHRLAQLHFHYIRLEVMLVTGLNLYGIRPNDLLDLSTLEAHLRFSHGLRLRACGIIVNAFSLHLNTYDAKVRVTSASYLPAQTTKQNFVRSEYSSFPSFILTYAYAASSSPSVSVISAISPVPVLASVKESDVADAYLRTSHVVSDLSDRTSSYACAISGSDRMSPGGGIVVVVRS